MQDSLRLLARELRRPVRVWHEHDHLRHPIGPGGRFQELTGKLWRRDDLEPELVALEVQRLLDVMHPKHDLGQPNDDAAHAVTAETIAARLMSLARGGTEQPGASSKPRPPVSATARRASASTSSGGP